MEYATLQDIIDLYRPLTPEETTKATKLIPIVCDSLRAYGYQCGRVLDLMVETDPALASVAKSVVVDVVARQLMTPTESNGMAPMTQYSQSALGYSVSGTFLSPGGGLLIKRTELARLGLMRQKAGVIDLDPNSRHNCDAF